MRRAALLLFLFLPCTVTRAQDSAAVHRAALDRDAVELSSYLLTMDAVTRLFEANHGATEAAKADPSIHLSLQGDEHADSPTIDQLAAKVASSPKLVSVLAEYSFTPRQFAVASMCLIRTGLAALAMQSGQTLDQVMRVAHVNLANLRLLAEHKAEIETLRTRFPTP